MARQADLLAVAEATERILRAFGPLDEEMCPLDDCLGRVLARPVESRQLLPPFANSSMDGFAVQSERTAGASASNPEVLPVAFTISAGLSARAGLQPGEAARIMTGAPLPEGADAVVPFEEVEDRGGSIALRAPVRMGACVRPAGQDVRPGMAVMDPGTVLQSPQIGFLAAMGFFEVPVVRKPRVAIVATGDELVEPGATLEPGQIYNSNVPMLTAGVREAGGEPEPVATVKDDLPAIVAALESARGADLLLTSGGASVGDFDHVKEAMGGKGNVGFWRVRVRPGKPLIFGSMGETPLIGLPGNPTSAMVTFEIFARPAIRRMLGLAPHRPEIEAVVDEDVENRGGRETYARVRLRYDSGQFHARLSGAQDSAMLAPLANADGLLVVPADVELVRNGETGRVLVWRLPE